MNRRTFLQRFGISVSAIAYIWPTPEPIPPTAEGKPWTFDPHCPNTVYFLSPNGPYRLYGSGMWECIGEDIEAYPTRRLGQRFHFTRVRS